MSHLRAKNLQKSYKTRKVVNNVTIEINSGEIAGLLGPNGAGKTTAFYMIVGLIKKEKGCILFDDQDISDFPIHARARLGIGYLPQEASIFRKLTVEQNILAILELRHDLTSQQRHEELEKLLNEFHISHIRKNISYSLSGGERRRVEISRALAMEPKFILLDEPFAGIDPISVVDIKHIIKHLRQRNIGILITDHNVRETLDICDRAYILNEGKIICEGNSQMILNNKQVRQVYLGDEFEL
jgi:lipopolysaccharide export system ATP-binding protein